MKRIVRLTESDLVRIVKRVISEETSVEEGRNNPLWVKLVSKLNTLSFPPKKLNFNSYDTPPIPSQSLNWGKVAGRNSDYGFFIPSTDSKEPEERMYLYNREDKKKHMQMHNWWKKRGYVTDGGKISISFKNADTLKNDIKSFFELYPPQ